MQVDTKDIKAAITAGMKTMLSEIEQLERNSAASGTGAKQGKAKQANKKSAPQNLEWQPNAKPGKIKVNQLPALYALADAQLLHLIYAMMPDADFPGSYVFMVRDTPQARGVLLPFLGKEITTAKKG